MALQVATQPNNVGSISSVGKLPVQPSLGVAPLAGRQPASLPVTSQPAGVPSSVQVKPLPAQPSLGVTTANGLPISTPQRRARLASEITKARGDGIDDVEIINGLVAQNPDHPATLQIKEAAKAGLAPKDIVDQIIAQNQGEQPKDRSKGFFGRLADDIKGRAQGIGQSAERTAQGQQSGPEYALQATGQIAGGVGDLISEGLVSAFRTLAPNSVETYVQHLGEGVGRNATVQKAVKGYENFKTDHPVGAGNIEALGNIASLIPVAKPEQLGAQAAKNALVSTADRVLPTAVKDIAAKGVEGVGGFLEKRAATSAADEALQIVRPTLNKAEKEAAIAAGRGEEKGILKSVEIKPSVRDREIAKSVEGIVSSKVDDFKNIDNVKSAIGQIGQGVEQELEGNNGIFNTNQLRSILSEAKEKSRVIFGTDKTKEAAYDAVVDEMVKIAQEQPQNLKGLWKARQAFDDVIEQKFGKKMLEDPLGDNVRRNAVRDVRTAVNEYVSSRLPEGNQYKPSLKQMTHMYDAIDNISVRNATRVGTNKLTRVIDLVKSHPYFTVGVGAGLLGGGIGGILGSPILMAALLTGGTVYVGSRAIKKGVIQAALRGFLKASSRTLNTQEIEAVKNMIENLDQGEQTK
jgi:hypothetical protein